MFTVEKTKTTPYVKISFEEGIMEISGNSVDAEVNDFFRKVLSELEKGFEKYDKKFVCRFNLNVFNSSTYKQVLNILVFLSNLYKTGYDVAVEWIVNSEDEDNIDTGKDLSEVFDLPFEIITVQN